MPLLYASVIASLMPANILFTVAGETYPADGLSMVPGAVVLGLMAGAIIAGVQTRRLSTPD